MSCMPRHVRRSDYERDGKSIEDYIVTQGKSGELPSWYLVLMEYSNAGKAVPGESRSPHMWKTYRRLANAAVSNAQNRLQRMQRQPQVIVPSNGFGRPN